ncbi:MAG TPA: tRNA pseudouridine(38-40) synthase TruA [Pyrinomonadaceae bacterium]|nr:tRNA pseudouridine(38-40) synthase TruA [Pyrinomonadaceae bacterium]
MFRGAASKHRGKRWLAPGKAKPYRTSGGKAARANVNFKLILQYDGTDFHGWQIQGELRTVQGELTRVVSLLEGSEVTVHGSGRTDAGVHAQGQVANVKLERNITAQKLRNAINGNLDRDVRVLFVDNVPDDFHARYFAIGKTYCYRVVHGQVMSPFWVRYAHQEARALDFQKMTRCARQLIGEHDWTAFSPAQSDIESRVRNITQLEISHGWDGRGRCDLIEFTISANGFLRYMVRSIVGTLLAVGRGEIDAATVARSLSTGKRELVGATAPAHGLTLMGVQYER